jgi:hypothetical protein
MPQLTAVETKKTGRAEALPVWLTKYLQADFTFSAGRQASTAWWLRASWPSSGFSLPCSCFLQFWYVPMVPLIKHLQPYFSFSDRERSSTAWWLRVSWPALRFSLPCLVSSSLVCLDDFINQKFTAGLCCPPSRKSSAAWWLPASWPSSRFSLPCSRFLRFFGRPPIAWQTRYIMHLDCQILSRN